MTIERNMKGTTLQLKLSGWLDTQSAPMFEEVRLLGTGVYFFSRSASDRCRLQKNDRQSDPAECIR